MQSFVFSGRWDKMSHICFLLLTKCFCGSITRKRRIQIILCRTFYDALYDSRQCGNHLHCPAIVSSAAASSLKNILFTGNTFEYELTMTLWLWHRRCRQKLCHFAEPGEVKTIHRYPAKNFTLFAVRATLTVPLAHFYFPAGSIHLHMSPYAAKDCISALREHAFAMTFFSDSGSCKNAKLLTKKKKTNSKVENTTSCQSHHFRPHVLERFAD